MTKNFLLNSSLILSCFTFNVTAHAYDSTPDHGDAVEQNLTQNRLYNNTITEKFTPRPATRTRIDYDAWNRILDGMVLDTGLSVRLPAVRKSAITGTRIKTGRGHLSPFRLEGNKVVFSLMDDEYKALIKDYQADLVETANRIDISSLPRNEQLAFWFNLHNATVISEIAQAYPITSPKHIRIGANKAKLDDAKIISIKGEQLSLKDIRTNIVYPNWKSPDVMYGFFTGNISSPSIQVYAYDAKNITQLLKRGAVEYANSLRGYSRSGNTRLVAKLYGEVAPYYFPNFDEDLSDHLSTHMRPEIYAEYSTGGKLAARIADNDIADTVKGRPYNNRVAVFQLATPEQAVNANSSAGTSGQTFLGGIDTLDASIVRSSRSPKGVSNFAEFFSELRSKYALQRRKGLAGTVTIEDIETIDPDIK